MAAGDVGHDELIGRGFEERDAAEGRLSRACRDRLSDRRDRRVWISVVQDGYLHGRGIGSRNRRRHRDCVKEFIRHKHHHVQQTSDGVGGSGSGFACEAVPCAAVSPGRRAKSLRGKPFVAFACTGIVEDVKVV